MRSLTMLLAVSCTWLACGGGGRQTPLVASPSVPAAEGSVQTRRTADQNTELSVAVEHLAPPDRVATGATTYVVWAQPLGDGTKPQNVGAMRVGRDRSGSLKTKTPHQSFELSVTPEVSPTVTEPTNQPVFKAKVAQ